MTDNQTILENYEEDSRQIASDIFSAIVRSPVTGVIQELTLFLEWCVGVSRLDLVQLLAQLGQPLLRVSARRHKAVQAFAAAVAAHHGGRQ